MKSTKLNAMIAVVVGLLLQTVTGAQEKEIAHVRTITSQETDATPDPAAFIPWLLEEMNNESMIRSVIKDAIEGIESEGRNQGEMAHFLSPDGNRNWRLVFEKEDLAVTLVGEKDGIYEFEARFKTTDGYRGGYDDVTFIFSFKARINHQPQYEDKPYHVETVTYPRYVKTDRVSRVRTGREE